VRTRACPISVVAAARRIAAPHRKAAQLKHSRPQARSPVSGRAAITARRETAIVPEPSGKYCLSRARFAWNPGSLFA